MHGTNTIIKKNICYGFSILYVFRRKVIRKWFEYWTRIMVQMGTLNSYTILAISIFIKHLATNFLWFYIAVIALQEFSLGKFSIQQHALPFTQYWTACTSLHPILNSMHFPSPNIITWKLPSEVFRIRWVLWRPLSYGQSRVKKASQR